MSPPGERFSKITAFLSKLFFVPAMVYCAAFARHALRGHFSPDDPMNISMAWRQGFEYWLSHCVRFWTTAYRPLGQLFYLSMFHFFQLNPLPYRIATLTLLVVNSYLACRLAERITGSRLVALLTGLFAGAHGAMVHLYYENDMIYDILAYFFSMLVMIRYVTIRKRGEVPSMAQSVLITCLFIAALDSKEISVTLAGFILIYELLFHGVPSWNGTLVWVKREGRLPLIFVLLALVYTAGKLHGADSLALDEGYKIHISVSKYLDSRLHHWNDLFYLLPIASKKIIIAIDMALLMVLVFFEKSPALRWCCFYALTAALPITFIPLRGGAQLYLPLFGWALLASIVFVRLIEAVSPTLIWGRFQTAPAATSAILVMLLGYSYVSETLIPWRNQTAAHLRDQMKNWSMMQQLKDLPFRPEHGAHVLFLADPFEDYSMAFIAQLVWSDHSLLIDLVSHHQDLTPEQIAGFDSLLTVEDGEIKLVRRQRDTVH